MNLGPVQPIGPHCCARSRRSVIVEAVGFEFFPKNDAEAALGVIHDLWETNLGPV